MMPKKICIIGPAGSGKTTAAQIISKLYNIPFTEMDKIVWNTNGPTYKKNSTSFISEHINKVIQKNEWIIEGAYLDKLHSTFKEADIIIVLNHNFIIHTYRIIKRLIEYKIRKKVPRETLKNTFDIIKYNQRFLSNLEQELRNNKTLSSKSTFCKNSEDIIKVIGSGFKRKF